VGGLAVCILQLPSLWVSGLRARIGSGVAPRGLGGGLPPGSPMWNRNMLSAEGAGSGNGFFGGYCPTWGVQYSLVMSTLRGYNVLLVDLGW